MRHVRRGDGDSLFREHLLAGNVYVGEKPNVQLTTVILDTGSSDLIIPVKSCKWCWDPKIDPDSSKTFKLTSDQFRIEYEGDHEASGRVAHDTISFGYQDSWYEIKQQHFGAVELSRKFGSASFAGVFGLAFEGLSEIHAPQPLLNFVKQTNDPKRGIVGIYIADYSCSQVSLGIYDVHLMDEPSLTWYPLDITGTGGQPAYWNVAVSDVWYGETRISSGPYTAAIDTGMFMTLFPHDLAEALYLSISPKAKKVSGKGIWHVPCGDFAGSVGFTIGSRRYDISKQDMPGYCVGSVVGYEPDFPNLIALGQSWMASWYTVLDYDRLQIGLAPSYQMHPPSEASASDAEMSDAEMDDVDTVSTTSDESDGFFVNDPHPAEKLYFIAVIEGKYKIIAGLHLQALEVEWALIKIHKLLVSHVIPNADLIRKEFACFSQTDYHFRDRVIPFPYLADLTTEAMNPERTGSGIHPIQVAPDWCLSENDNNSGITIMDITDPSQPSLSFVWPYDSDPTGPRDAKDYVETFLRQCSEPDEDWSVDDYLDDSQYAAMEGLLKFPLVPTPILRQAWPKCKLFGPKRLQDKAEDPVSAVVTEELQPAMLSLFWTSFRAAMEGAIESQSEDDAKLVADCLTTPELVAEALRIFRTQDSPDSCVTVLLQAIKLDKEHKHQDDHELDLRGYRLSSSQIIRAAEKADRDIRSLDLSNQQCVSRATLTGIFNSRSDEPLDRIILFNCQGIKWFEMEELRKSGLFGSTQVLHSMTLYFNSVLPEAAWGYWDDFYQLEDLEPEAGPVWRHPSRT
ncbi:hypothetical protein FRB99_002189 [Tulasnella sp. 403]|nr:hypothetical protein FRB99_002189 [Tulasnella sp. 403]